MADTVHHALPQAQAVLWHGHILESHRSANISKGRETKDIPACKAHFDTFPRSCLLVLALRVSTHPERKSRARLTSDVLAPVLLPRCTATAHRNLSHRSHAALLYCGVQPTQQPHQRQYLSLAAANCGFPRHRSGRRLESLFCPCCLILGRLLVPSHLHSELWCCRPAALIVSSPLAPSLRWLCDSAAEIKSSVAPNGDLSSP